MNILFIRNYSKVDGVFTLLLRLGKQFKLDGHNMFYIDFGIKTEFDTEISVTFTLLTPDGLTAGKNLPHIDVLFPFVGGDILYWCINELKNRHFKNAKFIMGAYHPRAYYVSTYLGLSPDTRIVKKVFSVLPSENIVFMNEIVKKEHEKYFKLPFTNSHIIPLPVKLEGRMRDFKSINRKKIVSVGRLENSKRYVIAMLEVMTQLANDGYEYEFYIYGHGQLRGFITSYIKLHNIGHYVFFMGPLEYKNLYSVLKDAYLFVGMGTVLIEASSMGVPALQAIESEKMPVTYGFFSELNGLSIGEVNVDFVKINMKESIIELAQKNEKEYYKLALDHIKRSSTFNIDEVIKQYYYFIENASVSFNLHLPSYKLRITKVLRQFYKFKFFTKIEHRNN